MNRGDLSLAEAEAALDDFRARLTRAFEETHASAAPEPRVSPELPETVETSPPTGVERAALETIVDALVTWPSDFNINPKLEKILHARRTEFDADHVDWALAEALAYGSLVLEGTPVRLAGQDTRRGTFSQRHGVLVDTDTEQEYFQLAHVAPDQAPFMLYDSVLSEYAALGFEYGYSVADPQAWVGWEAQFGDFMNGAQIIIDQFIVAAEDKWGQRQGSRCCSRTASRVRAPSTPARASSASSRCAPRTTSGSSTPPPPRSTSTCCGVRSTRRPASR